MEKTTYVTIDRVLNAVSKSVLGSRIDDRFTTMCVPPLWISQQLITRGEFAHNLQFYYFLLATSKTLYQSLKGLRLLQSCNPLVIGSWTTRKLLQTSEIYKYSITRAEITFPSGRRRERERRAWLRIREHLREIKETRYNAPPSSGCGG